MSDFKITCGVCGHVIKFTQQELQYYSPDAARRPVLGGELTGDDGPPTDILNCEKCPCILFPEDYAAKKPIIEKIEPKPKRKRTKRKKVTKKTIKKEEKGLDSDILK